MEQKGNKLILIPNHLGELNNLNFNFKLIDTIISIPFFYVENVRNARRFLKLIYKPIDIDNIIFREINKHSCVNFNEIDKVIEKNDIGIISEAGIPCVADPGSYIVDYCHKKNIIVKPLIGANSIILALQSSGLNGQMFKFNGYFPIKKNEFSKELQRIKSEIGIKNITQIFIETPYRNNRLYDFFINNLSPNYKLCVAKNLTMSSEYIKTKTIIEWKKEKITFKKENVVFVIGQ